MKILIVVDMQNDFITGTLGTKEAQAIVPNVLKKIKMYHQNEDLIIFTKDTHHSNYLSTEEGKHLPIEHCIEGTQGWLIESSISRFIDKNINDPWIIFKSTFGSKVLGRFLSHFYDNNTKVESIEFVGLCTDICVIANAVIAKTECIDVPVTVDASCCAGSTPEAHKKALDLMKNSLQIDISNMEE